MSVLKTGTVTFLLIAALTKPWSFTPSLSQSVCQASIFWTARYILSGENINQLSEINGGTTPMLSAIDNTECPKLAPGAWTQMLILLGADVNTANSYGYTPLMMAVGEQDLSITNLLLANGADITARDNRGFSALDIAKQLRNPEIVAKLSAAEDTSYQQRAH